MTESLQLAPLHRVLLMLRDSYEFAVDFGLPGVPPLGTDASPPLGKNGGPDSEMLLPQSGTAYRPVSPSLYENSGMMTFPCRLASQGRR